MSSRRSVSDSRNADWSRRTSRAGSPASANGHREHHRDKCKRVTKRKPPQKSIEQFWSRFTTTTPGKAFTILPDNLYAKRLAVHKREQENSPEHAVRSYEEAKKLCISKVDKIVKECRRVNQKYRDPHFDIESDFFSRGRPDCLMGLDDHECVFRPGSVKRVDKIFKNPRFFISGATANDVRQGRDGDCWLMSALCALGNMSPLIENVCVKRDEKVGVYGFVFHRDGEWVSEVIDDKLYLIKEDFDDATLEREKWLDIQNRKDPEEAYRRTMQTGSQALYFAQCSDQNETWLPLLEKAYAKAHGDYMAIEGGYVGEAIEDLTGGVTTEVFATDILDEDKFWHQEIMQVNKHFLFGCAQGGGITGRRKGIVERHAYSIMDAVEIDGKRLVKLRNPWGNTEWDGPWSDGSSEWTAEWLHKLHHRFGNDGVFWISYKDLLRVYQHFDRTRLFGKEWTISQHWTSLNVPWSVDYHHTKFRVTLSKPGPVVLVLSQLDERYFRGLQGEYGFKLQFRLHKEGERDYIVRSPAGYYMRRSVSTEVELEAGTYSVLLKIIATRWKSAKPVEDVIRRTCLARRDKLLSIGLSYDLAHAKGQFKESEKEKADREKREKRETRKAMAKAAYEARRKQRLKDKLRKRLRDSKREEKQRLKLAALDRATPSDDGQLSEDPQTSDDEAGLGINGLSKQVKDTTFFASPPETPALRFNAKHRRTDSRDSLSLPSQGRPTRRRSDSQTPRVEVTKPNGSVHRKLSISDISDDDLSWDSELDAPSDTDDDLHFQDPDVLEYMKEKPQDQDEEEDEFERDPWNAVCVVGLRVYSKDNEVAVSVVRPDEDDTARSKETRLDRDDPAADATKAVSGVPPATAPVVGMVTDAEHFSGTEPEGLESNRQG